MSQPETVVTFFVAQKMCLDQEVAYARPTLQDICQFKPA